MYRRKTSLKKDLEHLIYRQFWTSTSKTCIFNGKIFAGLSNLLFTCPEEHLQSNVSEGKSWKHKDFWINFEKFGTMAEKTFRVVKTAKDVQGNSLWKKFFQNRKIRFFFRFWAIFYFKRKLSPDLQNPQSTCAWKFVGKNIFWN